MRSGIDVLRQILLGAEPHVRRGRLQRLGARLGDVPQYVALMLAKPRTVSTSGGISYGGAWMDVESPNAVSRVDRARQTIVMLRSGILSRHGNQQRQSRHAF